MEEYLKNYRIAFEDGDGEISELKIIQVAQDGDKFYAFATEVGEEPDEDGAYSLYIFEISHFNDDEHNPEDFVFDQIVVPDRFKDISDRLFDPSLAFDDDEDDDEGELATFTVEDSTGCEISFVVWDTFFYEDKKYHICFQIPEDGYEDIEDLMARSPGVCFVEVKDYENEDDSIEMDKEWEVVLDEDFIEELEEVYSQLLDEDDDEETDDE